MRHYFSAIFLISFLSMAMGNSLVQGASIKIQAPNTKFTPANETLLPVKDPGNATNQVGGGDSYIQEIAGTAQITLFRKKKATPYSLNQVDFKNGSVQADNPTPITFPESELESLFLEYPLGYPMQAQGLPRFQISKTTIAPFTEIKAASKDFQLRGNQVFLKPELQQHLLRQFSQAKQKAGIADQAICNPKNHCLLLRLSDIKPTQTPKQFRLAFKTITLDLTQRAQSPFKGNSLNKGQQ